MKNSWKSGRYCRRFQTHQEMVANDENKIQYWGRKTKGRSKWCRAKRAKYRLDPWNYDKGHEKQRNWKRRTKKRKQYETNIL